MIYERAIREWNEVVPWKSPQMVEQDLVICRALVSIFSDDFLRENLASVVVRHCISSTSHLNPGTVRI